MGVDGYISDAHMLFPLPTCRVSEDLELRTVFRSSTHLASEVEQALLIQLVLTFSTISWSGMCSSKAAAASLLANKS